MAGEEHGEGGTPLLLVHGWCCDRRFLQPQLEELSASGRVVAIDLPGHGASAEHPGLGLEGAVDAVVHLIEELELERPLVAGHSMGGTVALALAERRPDLCRGIAMFDSLVCLPASLDPAAEGLSLLLATDRCAEALGGFVEDFLLRPDTPAPLRERVLSTMTRIAPEVALTYFESMRDFDDRGALKACEVPVLFTAVDNSLAQIGEMTDLNADVEVVHFSGVSHFHPIESPEETTRELARFLRRLAD